jgi:hypothetical protein
LGYVLKSWVRERPKKKPPTFEAWFRRAERPYWVINDARALATLKAFAKKAYLRGRKDGANQTTTNP